MKNKAGLIIPIVMILFGAYALLTTLGSSGEQVTLLSNHSLPRGLTMVLGLLGLGGGLVVMFSARSGKKHTARSL